DSYPRLQQTFNLVPSLLAQVEDYAHGQYQDLFLDLSRKPAATLTAEERSFVLRWMRDAPHFLRVQASPRYLELARRGEDAQFSTDEIRDLQVWFNLAWCDPAWVESDPRLAALKRKDRGFSEEDKGPLFEAQLEMLRRVIPKYRELAERGQAELTFSPFYHPILPLICHVDSARTASPNITLPQRHFSHREDAERQIELGRAGFERLLGLRPRGMWPPEMAVGESVASLAAHAGLDWIISDEEVLARSLETTLSRDGDGRVNQPELLYMPYRVEREGREVAIVFRDSLLSNLIGFDYHRMSAQDAARDFLSRLRRVRDQQGERDFLVTVALDGENAWEFYPRDGHDFLNFLYSELQESEDIVCTTVSGFLDAHAERRPLNRLHTGSWIGASLDTWIGDPEHNTAWDLLAQTRDWLADHARHHPEPAGPLAAAWREVLITEGSDWYWWFSRRHDSGMDGIWDSQFRLHLRNVYKVAGQKPPARLFQPIIERAPTPERRPPQASISPASRADPAWSEAGFFEVGSGFGALHRPVGIVVRVLYGADSERLYVRVDSPRSPAELAESGVELWLYCSGLPSEATGGELELPLRRTALRELGFEPAFVARVRPDADGRGTLTLARVDEEGLRADAVLERVLDDPLFFWLGFAELERHGGDLMELALVVSQQGR
ncbi:MAG TPA: glycoside hydrolase family 57 protein, partial [Candidatus Acidoferrales bacterium]|nr:glycoside hydrolase family 57 protein [Candidatus Acidoferrales bacterium]